MGMSGNFMAALVGKSSRLPVPPAAPIGVPLYSNTVGVTVLVVTSAMMAQTRALLGIIDQNKRPG